MLPSITCDIRTLDTALRSTRQRILQEINTTENSTFTWSDVTTQSTVLWHYTVIIKMLDISKHCRLQILAMTETCYYETVRR